MKINLLNSIGYESRLTNILFSLRFYMSIEGALYVFFGNMKLWIVRTDLVRCNHRLGLASGDATHVYWFKGSLASMVARATSQAASDSNI